MLPYKIRLFYKFYIFCCNITNNKILNNFEKDLIFKNLGYLRHIPDVEVPFDRKKFGLTRRNIFLPKFINIILVII